MVQSDKIVYLTDLSGYRGRTGRRPESDQSHGIQPYACAGEAHDVHDRR